MISKLTLFAAMIAIFCFIVPYEVRAQVLPGDGNGDGVIDGVDYLIWVVNYGKSTANGAADGDYNGNGIVDGLDYTFWLTNYGQTSQIPTPTQGPVGNVALHKQVTVSSTDDATIHPPQYVNDGNGSTRWSSAWTTNEWVQIDLGETVTISRVVLNWEKAYGKAYQIQVSANASVWETVYETTTGDGGVDDISGISDSARYIRMVGTQRGCTGCSKLYGYSLWEFEVYATGGTSTTNTPSPTSPVPATATVTPTQVVNTPTVTQSTPTSTGGGCYVKVAGYLYNMKPAVAKSIKDPNTGKTKTHSSGDFKCSTNPATAVDMTNTYLSKHTKLGCAQRLEPYIVTPPAPVDPICQ